MLVAALVVPVESLGYMATGIAVVSPMPLILLPAFHKLTDRARITGPDNRDIKLTPKQRAAVSFSWETDSDQLSVFGVTGHSVFTGSHAELGCLELAQHALNDNAKGSPIAQLGTQARSHEQAFNLLRAIGGLRGLLRALDSYRNDVNGRVFFQDLPPIYLTAFVLALGARTRDGTAHEALRERANASGLLAEEAEGI